MRNFFYLLRLNLLFRSDSYLSSPDINDIKLSARKLLRVSKKTQQMLDKAEKIGVQIDKDVSTGLFFYFPMCNGTEIPSNSVNRNFFSPLILRFSSYLLLTLGEGNFLML